jgi:hypothetical protein
MWLFLESYGIICGLSTIAFLIWAWRSKLRPDLDERKWDLDEFVSDSLRLEWLQQLIYRPPPDVRPLPDVLPPGGDLIGNSHSRSAPHMQGRSTKWRASG